MEFKDIKIGTELTLLELDEIVEEYIDSEEIQTPLVSFGADEIIKWNKYIFYLCEGEDVYSTIDFEVISEFKYEQTMIRVIGMDLC